MAKTITLPDGRKAVIDVLRVTVARDREIGKILNPDIKPEIKKDALESALAAWPDDKKPSQQQLMEAFTSWYDETRASDLTEDVRTALYARSGRLRVMAAITIDNMEVTEDHVDSMPALVWNQLLSITMKEYEDFLLETSTVSEG